jgi:hypothetical protein
MRLFFSIGLLALALACAQLSTAPQLCTLGAASPAGPVTSVGGRFQYSACDGHGRPLVLGMLRLTSVNGAVVGTWDTRLAPGVDPATVVGPQVGSGMVSGHLGSDGVVTLTFGAAPAGERLDLNGAAVTQGMRGTWQYVSGGKSQAVGNFVAAQLSDTVP